MSHARLLANLEHNLGNLIMNALLDPDVVEVLLNPDQNLWVEKHGQGMIHVGTIKPEQSRIILSVVASALNTTVGDEKPIVEGELPIDGSRFEGLMPPIVAAPSFTIRKKASKVFSLEEYLQQDILRPEDMETIHKIVSGHKNILVVGGTGSGKTTLVNGIINAVSVLCPKDRLIIIEDTLELQSKSKNTMFLRTSSFVTMQNLVRATMRLRPDRILVGEVRGGEALDLLKAWNTGHPGGVSTVHANSALGGLIRLEQLIAEASLAPMQVLIGEAVDLVIFIERHPTKGRQISQIMQVDGFDPLGQQYKYEYLYNLKAA